MLGGASFCFNWQASFLESTRKIGSLNMNAIDKLLGRLDVLPPAPRILPQLLAALAQPDTDMQRVVDFISFDPALTAKLLQTCNSAFFSRSRPVNDVSEAVSRLGFQAVYRTVAVVSGASCLKPPSASGIDPEELWRHSVKTAFAAQFFAEDLNEDSGMLFTAGLLHDLGKVVLASCPKKDAPTPGTPAEPETLHAEVGGRLLEMWKFSPQMAASVRFHHDPGSAGTAAPLAACVALASYISKDHAAPGTLNQGVVNGYHEPLAILNLEDSSLKRYRDRLEENMQFVESMCRM